MSDRGLALPRELPVCFPEPSDFSAGAFHNRSAHTQSIHEGRVRRIGRARLIPIIHRALSLVGGLGRRGPSLGGRYRYTEGIARNLSARLLRRFAGRTMRACGNHRGARTISLALVAGLAAFEAVLVFGAGAIGIPGVLLVRFADKGGDESSYAERRGVCWRRELHRQGARAGRAGKANACRRAGKACIHSSRPAAEPRLDGLADIPLKPWVSEKPKADEAKPDAPKAVRRELGREGSIALGCGRALSVFARRRCGARLTPRLRCPRRRAGNAAPARNTDCAAEAERGRGLGEGQGDRDQGRGAGPLALSFRVLARCARRGEAAAGRRRLRVQYARGHAAVASVERGERPASASAPAASLAPTRSPSR